MKHGRHTKKPKTRFSLFLVWAYMEKGLGEDQTLRTRPFFFSLSLVDWGGGGCGRRTKTPLETMRRRFTIWKGLGGKEDKKRKIVAETASYLIGGCGCRSCYIHMFAGTLTICTLELNCMKGCCWMRVFAERCGVELVVRLYIYCGAGGI
ncbi:hypothetical protein B0T19DRAFT_121958 [Cercophora scortea]|uniref:Uncharacterized protein n=1 Tax=Cercophora scortea TaxID=314031 RepID=A0AAE0MIB6_9PEZI|nr:hypothetical protein B0T19DRAFT_121958 [Cercophora scortea]